MKASIALTVSALILSLTASGVAQGTVNFVNYASGVNAPVYHYDCVTKLGGSNYMALLLAGNSPNDLSAVATTSFLSGGAAGYFLGGAVTLPNVPPGSNVWIRVVAWDSTLLGTTTGATAQQALEYYWAGHGDVWGASCTVYVVQTGGVCCPPTVPANLVGLQSFCMGTLGYVYFYFTAQPQSQTAIIGANVTFSVGVIAAPPPCYQWYHNGSPIPGARSQSYSITNVQPSDAGSYFVLLDNASWGIRQSDSATLAILPPPTITAAPQSRTAEAGADAGFSVSFTGTPQPACQWFFNYTNAIPGGTNPVLQLVNVQPAQSGPYSVVVSNVAGSITSPPAMLSVIPPVERRLMPMLDLTGQAGTPLNVDFADAAAPVMDWQLLSSVALTNASQLYFDSSSSLPSNRFYRAWQTGVPPLRPGLDLHMVPALTLAGAVGSMVRLDAINIIGPTDAWFTVATLVLTNTFQAYPDVSSIGKPPRLWRVVPLP